GERRNDGPKCFFIAVTMVRVMLSSREDAAWEGLSRYGKGGDEKLVGRTNVGGSLKRMQGICWRGDMRCGKGDSRTSVEEMSIFKKSFV
ncbi:hypothetical protein, partial [Bartonella sp. CM120XJJH]|uniref:hypothetical protein n=1 Tax=Bartonella sp. CM120XJJH TaxID=3243544 RepID=UPI0035CF047E